MFNELTIEKPRRFKSFKVNKWLRWFSICDDHFEEAAFAKISLTTPSEPPTLVSREPPALRTAKVGMDSILYLAATSPAVSTLTLARAMPVS